MTKLTKIHCLYQIIFLIIILNNINCLKHSKNKNKDFSTQTHLTKQHTNTKFQKHTQNTSNTLPNKNQSTILNKNIKDNTKTKDNIQKDTQDKQTYQFVYEQKQNTYVLPITVGSDTYHLGLIFDQKQSKYGSMPSWIFTSLTAEDHQLCDGEGTCQQVSKYIQCKDNNNCIDIGSSKHSSQTITSKRKVRLTFANNNASYSIPFTSPKKVTYPSQNLQQNEIQGMLNLALNNEQKYSNQIIISKNIITIFNQSQFQKYINNNNNKSMVQFDKGKLFSLTSKDIYIHAIGLKQKKSVSNIKESYKKFKIQFINNNLTMAIPKKALTTIQNILKKHYLGDRCRISDNEISCSAAPIKNINSIQLCNDNKGKKCLSLPILGYILQEEKTNQSYKLMITENLDENGNSTFIIYPRLAQIYTIFGSKGLIKRILPIANQTEPELKNTEKDQKTTNKQQNKQQQQQQQQQEKQNQHKQQTKQPKQTKPEHKKQTNKLKSSLHQKNKQKQPQQQQEEQQTQQNQNQQNQQQSTQPQTKTTPQHKLQKPTNIVSGALIQQQQYSKHLLFFVFVYGLVFIAILIVIKFKAQESVAAQMIDKCLDIIWYGIVKNYFNKSRGYNPPKLEEECGGGEQIDHSDSVAVGYSEQQGRQLFWQKNSVEGI